LVVRAGKRSRHARTGSVRAERRGHARSSMDVLLLLAAPHSGAWDDMSARAEVCVWEMMRQLEQSRFAD
jgi:hypothetical protein